MNTPLYKGRVTHPTSTGTQVPALENALELILCISSSGCSSVASVIPCPLTSKRASLSPVSPSSRLPKPRRDRGNPQQGAPSDRSWGLPGDALLASRGMGPLTGGVSLQGEGVRTELNCRTRRTAWCVCVQGRGGAGGGPGRVRSEMFCVEVGGRKFFGHTLERIFSRPWTFPVPSLESQAEGQVRSTGKLNKVNTGTHKYRRLPVGTSCLPGICTHL